MARTPPRERIRRAAEACNPACETGRMLLDHYLSGVDLDRPGPTAEQEVWNVRELCRLVEQHTFTPLSLEALERAAEENAPSKTALKRRRLVVGRLIRLLEEDGFPTRAERRDNQHLHAELQRLPGGERENLARWLAHRHEDHGVSWHELLYEARRVAELELLAVEAEPDEYADDLLHRWLAQTVKRVVACRCAPVTRLRNPFRCSSCGATPETHGTRPSPNPKKQKELLAIGRRYLASRPTTRSRTCRDTQPAYAAIPTT